MTRITSLLTIALAIAFGLTLGASSAGAGHSRSNCETRIFQGEDQVCFEIDGGTHRLFSRGGGPTPDPSLRPEEQAGGFTFSGLDCGCQLRRKNDLICAGSGLALIGAVDRRGRRISGETLGGGQTLELSKKTLPAGASQEKFFAKRVDLVNCEEQ